jgi:hypothetical protein
MPADNAVDSFIVTPAKACVKKWKSLSFVMAGLDLIGAKINFLPSGIESDSSMA